MSAFGRGIGMNAQMVRANFDMAAPPRERWAMWGFATAAPWEDAMLWPTAKWCGAGYYFGDGTEASRYGPPPEVIGGNQMRSFSGTTRDSAGAVLGSAVVQAFLTASDQFVREVTSDAGGYFDLRSQFPGVNHYLVAYKPGSPDQAGTTVNTLQPT